MKTVHKACPCVLRHTTRGVEVLVFEHPLAGWQIPKGTVEDGEDPAAAALRELDEESGLGDARIVSEISTIDCSAGAGNQDRPSTVQTWHLYHVEVPPDIALRERWTHAAVGSEDEKGLLFSYFWFDVFGELSRFGSFWGEVFRELRRYCERLPSIQAKEQP